MQTKMICLYASAMSSLELAVLWMYKMTIYMLPSVEE